MELGITRAHPMPSVHKTAHKERPAFLVVQFPDPRTLTSCFRPWAPAFVHPKEHATPVHQPLYPITRSNFLFRFFFINIYYIYTTYKKANILRIKELGVVARAWLLYSFRGSMAKHDPVQLAPLCVNKNVKLMARLWTYYIFHIILYNYIFLFKPNEAS